MRNSSLTPWLWLPLLVLLSLRWSLAESLSIAGAELAIPVAAYLGHRYGRRGLMVVALGGLLLPVGLRYGVLASAARPDLYLAALLVGGLAAAKKPLQEWVGGWRPGVLYSLAFLLLPLSLGLYGAGIGSGSLFLVLRFSALFFLFAFLAGISPLSARNFALTLAGFTLAGMALESVGLPADGRALFGGPRAEFPLVGLVELHNLWIDYHLDRIASLLAALGFFHAGRRFRRLRDIGDLPRTWWTSWGMVTGLAVVALGGEMNRFAVETFLSGPAPAPLLVLGTFYALPGAALLGGLLLRWRGISLVLGLVALFWCLDALLRGGLDLERLRFLLRLEEPLAVLGFGVLGIALRDAALRVETRWWSPRWCGFALLLVLLTASFVAEAQSLREFVWISLGFCAALGGAVLLAWLRKRLLGRLPTHGGWSSLAALLLLSLLAWQLRDAGAQVAMAVRELYALLGAGFGSGAPPNLRQSTLVVLSSFLLFAFVWLGALQAMLTGLPHCRRDVNSLLGLLGLSTQKAPGGTPADGAAPSWCAWLSRALRTLRYAALVLAVAPPAATTLIKLYPPEGLGTYLRELFAREEEKRDAASPAPRREEPPRPPADAHLYQAAREWAAAIPLLVEDPVRGLIRSDWHAAPGTPEVRERVEIHIGRELAAHALRIELRRQQRGLLGVWVEQDKYWDSRKRALVGYDLFERRQALEAQVLARAGELAQNGDEERPFRPFDKR